MTAGVFEYIVDSATGIPSGPLDCLVVGVCSQGTVGSEYIISKKSDIKGTLGVGPMVDRIYDIFQEDTGELGRNINLVVAPVAKETPAALPTLTKSGSGPDVSLSGTQLIGMKLVVRIDKGGDIATETVGFNYSIDGGHNYESETSIEVSSSGLTYVIPDSGVTITFAGIGTYVLNETYKGTVSPPTATLTNVLNTTETALGNNLVKRVFITGPSNKDDWDNMGLLADDQFALHRPVSIIAEFRGLDDGEVFSAWSTNVRADRALYEHPYIDVVAVEGDAICHDTKTRRKSLAGYYVGRTLSIKTNRHIGRVRSGKIRSLNNIDANYLAEQEVLESAGLITVTNFAGLSGYYWGDDRTLAPSTSTYKSVRPRETVFKALRISRAVALQYINDEAGSLSGSTGLSALKADIETAIFNAMIGPSSPQELKGIVVTIPDGQDPEIGIDVELDFLGIPVIRKLSLYAKYSTKGASLSEAA